MNTIHQAKNPCWLMPNCKKTLKMNSFKIQLYTLWWIWAICLHFFCIFSTFYEHKKWKEVNNWRFSLPLGFGGKKYPRKFTLEKKVMICLTTKKQHLWCKRSYLKMQMDFNICCWIHGETFKKTWEKVKVEKKETICKFVSYLIFLFGFDFIVISLYCSTH